MGTLKLNKNLNNKKEVSEEEMLEAVKQTVNETSKICVEKTELLKISASDEGFVEEMKILRDTNSVVYKRNDRTYRKIIYSVPRFYCDDNDDLKEIKNSLSDNGTEIVNNENSFKVSFSKDANNGKIFGLYKGGKELTLSAVGSTKARGHKCGCRCVLCEDNDNTVTAILDDGTEIEYVTLNDRIKENIIVKERQESYEYNFALNIGNLTAEEGQHNDLLLKDKLTGETQFRIPAPYMFDTNGVRSDNVSYEIEVNGEELEIKVVADAEFINAEDRALPVIIDPQITLFYSQAFSYTTIESSIYSDENDEYDGEMRVYAESGDQISRHVNVSINKENIAFDGVLDKVELVITSKSGAHGSFNVNGKTFNAEEKTYTIDITNLYVGNNNYTSFYILGNEPTNNNGTSEIEFYSTGEYAPKLVISYIENEVNDNEDDDNQVNYSHNRPNIKTFELGDKANGYLDLNSAELVTEVNDLTVGSKLPVEISHMHKLGSANEGFGNNWRLNIANKTLKSYKTDTDTVTQYSYKDELGNIYTFSEKFYYYSDGQRVPVEKNKVVLDPNGELNFEGNRVYVQQMCNDLTLIAKIEDYINSETFEQRQNEQIELEEKVKSYEQSLSQLVIADVVSDADEGNIIKRLESLENSHCSSFIKEATADNLIMSESEALNLQSMFSKIKLLTAKIEKLANKTEYEQEYNEAVAEKSVLEAKKTLCISRAIENQKAVKDDFENYFKRKRELENYKEQAPVNYLRDSDGIISGFNEDGKLVCIFDSYGNAVSIEYNSDGNISAIYEGELKVADFSYIDGQLDSITDNRGRKIKFKYEEKSKGKLESINYPDGEKSNIKYASNRVSGITSSSMQSKLSYGSDGEFNRLTVTRLNPVYATVAQMAVEYTADSAKFTYSDGIQETYKFDSAKNLKKYAKLDETLCRNETSYKYQTNDIGKKITTETHCDPDYSKAIVNIKQYNDLELLVTETDDWQNISDTVKVKAKTIYEYDLTNKLISKTVTKYRDSSGYETEKEIITNYSYNTQGELTLTESYVVGEEQTNGKNFEERVYNSNGNMIKCIRWNSLDSSSKFYEEYEREKDGSIKYVKDETGAYSAMYEYVDGTNEVNAVTYANGGKLAYGRNPYNNQITSVTQSTADGEASANNIVYEYGLPVKVTSGNTTLEYQYEQKGRKTQVKVNGTVQSEYSYEDYKQVGTDAVKIARVAETLNIDGSYVKSVYLKEGTLDGTAQRMKVTESLTVGSNKLYLKQYNANGELTDVTYKTTAGDNVIRYEYNNYHSPTKAVTTASGVTKLTETYAYNNYGELTQKAITGEVAQTYSYTYKSNAARDLDYITFGTYKFKPLTDVNGRSTGKEIYNGTSKFLAEYVTYRKVGDHATNMPAAVWFGSGKNISDSIKYKYDSCGNISEITQNGHIIARYTYDSLNRLIREDNKLLDKTVIYTYDSAGNITEKCKYEYTEYGVVPHEETSDDHISYDYDGDKLISYDGYECKYNSLGNPTSYRGYACEWQYGKWLTKYGTKTFEYDGLGRRTKKGNITYTYDSDGRLLNQSDGLEFFYDASGVAGVKYEGKTFFYRKDAQGNIIAILTDAGKAIVRYAYDAWGNNKVYFLNRESGKEIFQDTSNKPFDFEQKRYKEVGELNPFRYRGYYYDNETGLYYLQTRYYDPEVGRFISQDNVDYADPEAIYGLNLYAYCANNPVMNVDPTGHAWWHWLLGGIIIVAAVALSVVTAGLATPISAALGGGMLGAIVGGAVAGGIGGAIAGFGISVATQAISNGFSNINWEQVGFATLGGAITGAILGGLSNGIKYARAAQYLKSNGITDVKGTLRNFKGIPSVKTSYGTTAYRYYDGVNSLQYGRYLTNSLVNNPINDLVLYNNQATMVSKFVINDGAKYLVGRIAGSPINALQYFVANINWLTLIG